MSDQQNRTALKSTNLDISILNSLAGRSPSAMQFSTTTPFSLNKLSQVLKAKNQKFASLEKQEKRETKEWLKSKGIEFKKINEQIKANEKLTLDIGAAILGLGEKAAKMQPATVVPQDKGFGMTPQQQDEFIIKQKRNAVSNMIASSLRNRPKNNFHAILVNKIGSKLRRDKSSIYGNQNSKDNLPSFSQQASTSQTRRQYFNFAYTLGTSGFEAALPALKAIRPFWKVVLAHIEVIQRSVRPGDEVSLEQQRMINKDMMIASLCMVEDQFSRQLGNSNVVQDLTMKIKEMENRNRRLKVWRDHKGQPIWGLVYFLFRANRMHQLAKVLGRFDNQFLQDLILHQNSIHLGNSKPFALTKYYQLSRYNNDSFYSQLVYLITGKPSFNQQLLLQDQNFSLSRIWILLRAIGIYRHIPEIDAKYQQLTRTIMTNEYTDENPEKLRQLRHQRIVGYCYLGLYQHFLRMTELFIDKGLIQDCRHVLNEDDFVHLLIVLVYYHEAFGVDNIKRKCPDQDKLLRELLNYMNILRAARSNIELTRYVLLCPTNKLEILLSSFIQTRQEYEQFDWSSLGNMLRERDPVKGDQVYRYLSFQVFSKLSLKTFFDFDYASEMYSTVFSSNPSSAYKCQVSLIKLLLQHLYLTQKKCYSLKKGLFNQKQYTLQTQNFYEIDQRQKHQPNLMQAKNDRIRSIIQNAERFLSDKVNEAKYDSKESEKQNNSEVKSKENYQVDVIQPWMLYKEYKKLIEVLRDPLENFGRLKGYQPQWIFKCKQQKYTKQEIQSEKRLPSPQYDQTLTSLLKFLLFELPQSLAPLYVYYLNRSIEAMKLLTDSECNYFGLLDYYKNIDSSLELLKKCYNDMREKEAKSTVFRLMSEREQIKKNLYYPFEDCKEYSIFEKELQEYIKEYSQSKDLKQPSTMKSSAVVSPAKPARKGLLSFFGF